MSADTTELRFRFAPRESRGLLLGLRPRQVVILAVAGVSVFIGAAAGTAGLLAGVLFACGLGVACFVPVGGRSAEEWAPIAGRWLWRGTASRRWRGGPVAGESDGITLPPPLDALTILAVTDTGRTIAVAADRRRGTYTAVLASAAAPSPCSKRPTRPGGSPPGAPRWRASPAKAPPSPGCNGPNAPCPTTAPRCAAGSPATPPTPTLPRPGRTRN